jgi:integrase
MTKIVRLPGHSRIRSRVAARWEARQVLLAARQDCGMTREEDRPEMQTWTAEELRAFLSSAQGHPLFALYRLAASTGMRRGKCLGLRWKDVQLDAARLSVRQQLSRQGEKVGFGPVKSTAGRRSIALDSVTVAAIRAHRQAQALSASRSDPRTRTTTWCSPTVTGARRIRA